MTNQDIDKLKQAIADGSGVLSDSELAQAKKLLDFLKISQGTELCLLLTKSCHYLLFVRLSILPNVLPLYCV